jgi:hypothetical protein
MGAKHEAIYEDFYHRAVGLPHYRYVQSNKKRRKVMSWKISGEFIETCSCNMLCPCWYGKPELMVMDQGWCGTSFLVRVREGDYEGTDLSGQNAVVGLFFPGPTLFDGNGTARVYIDEGATADQQAALEKILQGLPGGGMEVPATLLSNWLPTQRSSIAVEAQNGRVQATIGSVGEVVSERLVNDQGDKMTMHNATFNLVFGFEDQAAELAPSEGTSWNDPEMPQTWVGKSGAVGQIAWKGE